VCLSFFRIFLAKDRLLPYIAHLPCGSFRPPCVPLAHFETHVYLTHQMSVCTLQLLHVLFLSLTFIFLCLKWTYLTYWSYYCQHPLLYLVGTHQHGCVLHTLQLSDSTHRLLLPFIFSAACTIYWYLSIRFQAVNIFLVSHL
jgi:hypothetical protein